MSDDEKLDETFRQTLLASRRPPEPPLESMWREIERQAFGAAPVRAAASVKESRWGTATIAAAAALVIGVALGRYVVPPQSPGSRIASAASHIVTAPVATTPIHTADVATTRGEANRASSTIADARSVIKSPAPGLKRSHRTTGLDTSTDASANASANASAARLAAQLDDVGGSTDMSRYLMRTAALLTALPSGRSSPASNAVIVTRASELLTDTHLLLDSQAGSDPTLHRLLEDLELVLAQVARLRAPHSGPDLQLIHQALAFRDVLPRVHDAAVEASITED